MAKLWSEVEQSEVYQKLPDLEKSQAKKQYFDNIVSQNKDFQGLSDTDKESAKKQFLGNVYEGEIISKKEFGKRQFPSQVAGVGQFLGGLGGGVIGGFFGHPYIGGAVGGTAGRALGRIVAQPNVLFNPLARKKFGQELATTAGVEAVTAPLALGGVKLGRGIVKSLMPTAIAERGLQRGFKPMLKPEYYKEEMPKGFVERVSNLFNTAQNKYGELVDSTIKKYNKFRVNLGNLKTSLMGSLKEIGIDDIPSIDKIDTLSIRDRDILKNELRKVLNLTKENAIPENLWEVRKNLDKLIYNKSWKEEGLEILQRLRKILNEPLRNIGDDVASAFDEYSFIMQGKEELAKKTSDIVKRKTTGEIFSQDIENFVNTLMSPAKSETRRLLTSIDKELANEMFNVSSAKILGKQFIPSTPWDAVLGLRKFGLPVAKTAAFMQKPTTRMIGKGMFRLLPTTATNLLTEEE